ncbi:MAG TPA: PH domain-containing protein [Syntrophomonadaceae bacterium]|nr:PH domain-containing protein [Syntrophomonadaceae bacterium]
MRYSPKKSYGVIVGLLLGIAIFGFIIWGISYSLGPSDQALKMALAIPAYFFLFVYFYLLIGAFTLDYEVNNSGFTIKWGVRSIQIRWDQITEVIEVKGRPNLFSILGISWPGYIIGLYSAKGIGTVRMYATKPQEGFIYLKTETGFFGITPENSELSGILAEKAQKSIETIDVDSMDPAIKGKSLREDRFYNILYKLNLIFLILFAAYLIAFYPGSSAPRFTILLLVLAVALFFFNISNASRLYNFSEQGGYILMGVGLAVTGTFFILALSEISF